jgi:hypothetical protein
VYKKCADEFEFRIVNVDGTFYSTANELYKPLGYANGRSVSDVLKNNNIETLAINTCRYFAERSNINIKEALGLSLHDGATKLIDYKGFLFVSLYGKGSNCDKVREYLLKMEEKARIDSTIYANTGYDTADFKEVSEYQDDPILQSIITSQKAIQEVMKLRISQIKSDKKFCQR